MTGVSQVADVDAIRCGNSRFHQRRGTAPAALSPLSPDRRQKTGSGRLNKLELPCAYRGLRGKISLFCLMRACHQKGYKYKHIGFALKAPDGTE